MMRSCLCLVLVGVVGCSASPTEPTSDAGVQDAALGDASHPRDAALDARDAFALDASGADAFAVDAFAVDAFTTDAGMDAASACSGLATCIADAPAGWTGPLLVYQGAGAAPACPALTAVAFDGGTGLVAPPAACSSCGCSPASGIACSDPTVTLATGATCSGAPCATHTFGASCTQIKSATECNGPPGTQVYVTLASTAVGGTCAPSTQTPVVTPATWTTNVRACADATSTSCGAGHVCAAPATSTYARCIYRGGDVTCPAGPYATRTLVDTSFTDDRSCSACGCGSSNGTCSGGAATISPNPTCGSGVPNTIPVACGFDGIPPTVAYYAAVVTPPVGAGTCASSGGAPMGSAAGTGPTTICCL